jgi:serine/threonine protein kinase
LGDFGLSKRAGDDETLSQGAKGTLDFMAPELLGFVASRTSKRPRDDRAADIWSLGVLVFLLVVGKLPFKDVAALSRFVQSQTGLREELSISAVRVFIQTLMAVEPENRPTAQEALEQAWLERLRALEPVSNLEPEEYLFLYPFCGTSH